MKSHFFPERHLVVGLSSLILTDAEKHFLEQVQPAGVILFSRNIQTLNQLLTLINSIHTVVGQTTTTLWIDQEGGRVQRLRHPFTRFPSPFRLAQLFRTDPKQAKSLAKISGQLCGLELASMGIGINCAPVLDIRELKADPVIGERAFGSSPQEIIPLAQLWIEGLKDQGIMPVGKHFPGHGAAQSDSHKTLPIISRTSQEMEQWEFLPFKTLLPHLPALMTAHLVAAGLGETLPATWSPTLLKTLLRQQWGFTGLLVSDAIEMGALSGSLKERAFRSIHAGCDLVLCCTGRLQDSIETLQGITQALHTLDPTETKNMGQRIERSLTPYRLPPGDWENLLKNPDYQHARKLIEKLADTPETQDPTELNQPFTGAL